MFGKRAESLASHFTKGTQIVIYADDLQVETYPKTDGTQGVKLKCKLVEFDFAGGQQSQQQAGGFQQQAPQQQQAAPQRQQGFAPQQQAQQQPQGTAGYGQGGPVPQQAPREPVIDFDDSSDIPF